MFAIRRLSFPLAHWQKESMNVHDDDDHLNDHENDHVSIYDLNFLEVSGNEVNIW